MSKLKFGVIEGGNTEAPSRDGENWLAKEPKGAVFLYRPYGSRKTILSARQILFQWGDVALLAMNVNGENGEPITEYVDTALFSNLNEKVKTIFVPPPQEELHKEQDNDGNQVHAGTVE